MSEGWEDEYYPTPASEATSTELEAARHSLKKWQGMDESILKDYGLVGQFGSLWHESGEKVLDIDRTSCALCLIHKSDCNKCILYISGSGCDTASSPYREWGKFNDHIPMVEALESCVANLEESGGNDGN